MVMHARKLPRLSDGYFDRNQTHPYQNSSSKYSKVGYNDRYNDKVRDSPTNGSSAYRSESPEGSRHSPRDRSYHNKASYSQRIKERERDRDNKHDKDSTKDKAKVAVIREHYHAASHRGGGTEGGSSSGSGKSEHQNNLDRTNSTEEKEKRLQVGDWSEHISSSGKKYYYNCKTEISQWEKPREWVEFERQQGKLYTDASKLKDGVHDKHSSERSARSVGHSHQSGTRPHDERHHARLGATAVSSSSVSRGHSTSAADHVHRNSQQQQKEERQSRQVERPDQRYQTGDPLRRDGERRTKSRKSSDDSQLQDMDISSDGTPPGSQSDSHSQNQTPVSFSSQPSGSANQQTPPSGNSSLASLPKLLSQLTGSKGMPNNEKQELLTHEALQTLQTALYLTRHVTLAHPSVSSQSPHSSLCVQSDMSQRSPAASSSHSQGLPLSAIGGDQKSRSEEDRTGRSSPGSDYSHQSSRRESPTSSICSLQGISTSGTTSLASASLRPTSTCLTPSLANYFRDDLIGHIMGWQADHAERQANKYGEDAHHIGSLTCTKVSADLKMSRSLVRVGEIQATVQEQRILFLRQQIKELEEWKSQNSFMSDS